MQNAAMLFMPRVLARRGGEVSRCRDIQYTDVRVYRAPWLDEYCGKAYCAECDAELTFDGEL